MFFSLVSVVALYATTILAAPRALPGRVCAGTLSDGQVASAEAHFRAHANMTAIAEDAERKKPSIPVYWHVIRQSSSASGGHLTASKIKKQIEVLNKAFAPAKIQFALKATDYTTNKLWFEEFGPYSALNSVVKTKLHKGNKRALNVYSTGFINVEPDGLLGVATWPWLVADELPLDGVSIKYSTLPGGISKPFDQGKTLVHEVGHWLGLFHTFQGGIDGGCLGPGDLVSDTPAEGTPTEGCPKKKDSCPSQKGQDPIHNYMDYGDDSCMFELTKGQVKRLREQSLTYRGI